MRVYFASAGSLGGRRAGPPSRYTRVALGVIALALAAFAAIAYRVATGGESFWLNTAVTLGLHAYASPALDAFAVGLARLGSPVGTWALGLLAMGLLAARGRRPEAAGLALSLAGGATLIGALKHLFRQARPHLFAWLLPENGYSFPSGHAIFAVCLYGYLAATIVGARPGDRRARLAAAGLVAMIPLLMASRVYLGVHWLSDVTAGACVALAWTTFCLLLVHHARRRVARA